MFLIKNDHSRPDDIAWPTSIEREGKVDKKVAAPLRRLGLQQIIQPSRPGPFFLGHMQLAPQTVDELQHAARFRFHNQLHYQLATAIEDSDYHPSLCTSMPTYLRSRLMQLPP
jgi:hypothetical protein